MKPQITRTIQVWRSVADYWGWEVTLWRGPDWLTRSSGLADSEAAAREQALAYQGQYPLRVAS